MHVIIGAGPAGLYTAIKLKNEGVKDIVVFDPRAGEYTRPGHLNERAFTIAEFGIGKELWKGKNGHQFGHIKDIEKILYQEALSIGIKIEKKRFVGFSENKNGKIPGVLVSDGLNEVEFIPSYYVFDCSGAKRIVIKAVNERCPDSPFKTQEMVNLPVKNHFLAYVQMNESELDNLHVQKVLYDKSFYTLSAMNSLDDARNLVNLRNLGWKEFALPDCYGRTFIKDKKVCMYIETPDNLTTSDYNVWVKSVMKCYSPNASYQQLPTSKKYRSKPNFVPFHMHANSLEEVGYQGKNLPKVIALGDAQIDPNYKLAHGITNGFNRINELFACMIIIDGAIYDIDEEKYLSKIKPQLKEHRKDIIKEADKIKKTYDDVLEPAKALFLRAKTLTTDNDENVTFNTFLIDIEARQSYLKGSKLFAEFHDESKKVKIEANAIDKLVAKLNMIHSSLLNAHQNLPIILDTQRQDTENLLVHLALSWKEVGNKFYNKNNTTDALDAYEKAVEIYKLPFIPEQHTQTKISTYSNLVIAYNTGF